LKKVQQAFFRKKETELHEDTAHIH